ncbi:hypothetical protein Tco_0170377, partial [Tanacetum coccineum]
EIISQAKAKIRNHGVSADRDPAGIDSAGGISAGSTSAGSDPAGSFEPADKSNPAVSSSVSANFNPVYADESTSKDTDKRRALIMMRWMLRVPFSMEKLKKK